MFSINGKLFKALTKAGDFIILGVLMWVFSIPVVTLGASVTAAFYVGLKLVRDEEGYVFKDFWKSFKANFKQGLIIGIIITIKIIDYLFKKYHNKVYSFVSGILLSSITLLIIQTLKNRFTLIELIIGIILLIIGILLSNKMEEK